MKSRVQRHMENKVEETTGYSRVTKNNYLYDEINSKIGYEEIVNLDTQTKINLSNLASSQNREEYQKLKDYQEFLNPREKEKFEYNEEEKKNYDINSILEEAKKNRVKFDELERKRKLRESDYVTMPDISTKDTKSLKGDVDEKELTELINTITSHNLLEEIRKIEQETEQEEDLLSELIATNVDLNLEEGIAKEFMNVSTERKIDDSFYTKSMDLSEHDFELSDEIEAEKTTKIRILIVISIIIIIVGIIVFFILKQKGII